MHWKRRFPVRVAGVLAPVGATPDPPHRPLCRRPVCLIALLLAMAQQGAQASQDLTDLPLEQLMNESKLIDASIVGASRFRQRVSTIPSAVTVISREDIQQYGWRTVAEALRSACDAIKVEDLETALHDIAPEDTTAGPLSTSNDSPVERRKRPILPRRALLPAGAALVLVTVIAFSVGSRFGGRDGGERAAAEPSSSASASANTQVAALPPNRIPPPPGDTPPDPPAPTATTAPSPVPGKTQATSAPKGTAGASAKPAGKPKPTKPVATRPDF